MNKDGRTKTGQAQRTEDRGQRERTEITGEEEIELLGMTYIQFGTKDERRC